MRMGVGWSACPNSRAVRSIPIVRGFASSLLAPGGMRTPTIYVLLQIFTSRAHTRTLPDARREIDHIGRRERSLWQRGVEQLVDHFATCDTDLRTGLSSRMCGNDDPQAWSGGRKREIREVKERSTRSRFGMARLLVWGLCETSLNRLQIEEIVVLTSHHIRESR
jgi:hypothetical protein